ncbi:hypothetical protein PENTCL1PPCAC_23599, partial [Pristionchus entomophagus]
VCVSSFDNDLHLGYDTSRIDETPTNQVFDLVEDIVFSVIIEVEETRERLHQRESRLIIFTSPSTSRSHTWLSSEA